MATVMVNKMVKTEFSPEIAFDRDISWYDLVRLMHDSWVINTPACESSIPKDRADLRANLMLEEVKEMVDAQKQGNLVEVADGLADCLVILLGTALEYGVFVDTRAARVQSSITDIDLGGPRWDSAKAAIDALATDLKAFAVFFHGATFRSESAFEMVVYIGKTAKVQGIPLNEVFREVMRSNFTKLLPDGTPLRREDGKILKGPNYEPPRIEPILREAGLL